MNAARLFVSILNQMQQPNDEQAQVVKRIDRSLTAAEELLSALLDISKLDSGMYSPEPEALDVADLFEQLRRRFKPLAVNRDLKLRVRSCDARVFSDRKLLYRILQNFLANAIRYTERGGVLLGCRRRGNRLELGVWDTGVGIDDSEKELIFQEFHRLEYAQRLDERGLGLGLAICERIARMLGHEMQVRSEPGRGSCFSVLVPLTSEAAAKTQPGLDSVPGELSPLGGLSVLCVDNEPDILDGMKMLLERWGCAVLLAESLDGATQLVQQSGAPGFLLVDYHLGGQIDGLDVLSQLESTFGTRVPAIVITADRSPELENAVRARGYGLLRKPIKPAALRTLMTNMLKSA
jgi:CheY-like chemotaxis protein